jgi:competence protein ComEC
MISWKFIKQIRYQYLQTISFTQCKRENILLFYGISFFLGILFQITTYFPLLLILFFLLYPKDIYAKKIVMITILFFIAGFVHAHFFYHHPQKTMCGEGTFHISSVKESTMFTKGYLYKGTFTSFIAENEKYKNIPCSIYTKASQYKIANCDYFLEGKLRITDNKAFIFKPTKWRTIAFTHSFAELRFKMKQWLTHYLETTIADRNTQNFIKAIISGDIDNQLMQFAFAKTGLSYLLVISGLHFNLIIMFFTLLLWPFNYRLKAWILLAIVNLYFFFVGNSAPIERAYITISLILFSHILSRCFFSLNALGFALLCQTILNPLIVKEVGFQLSYVCCMAIFLIYPWLEKIVIKERSLEEKKRLTKVSYIGSILLTYLKKAFLFSFIINVTILPIILYYFHKFSLMTFIYNTLFPVFMVVTIFLFFLSLLLYPLCGVVSIFIGSINNFYTYHLLNMIFYPPAPLMVYWRLRDISPLFLTIYLTLLFFLSFIIMAKRNETYQQVMI